MTILVRHHFFLVISLGTLWSLNFPNLDFFLWLCLLIFIVLQIFMFLTFLNLSQKQDIFQLFLLSALLFTFSNSFQVIALMLVLSFPWCNCKFKCNIILVSFLVLPYSTLLSLNPVFVFQLMFICLFILH